MLYQSVIVKIYWSIYALTLIYGHELWVVTKISWIQAAEMSFLCRVAGHSLRDRVRSFVTWEELGVEPLLLHIKRSQLRWLRYWMPLGCLPWEVFLAWEETPRKTQDTLE